MDQSFNDKELADIMSEIESLEKEFSPHNEPSKEPVIDQSHEEVLQELTQKPEEETILKSNFDPAPVYNIKPSKNSEKHVDHSSSSLKFKVSGQMKVELSFEVGGEFVELQVTEQGLHISLLNGTSFKVPLNPLKKSA
jgi:hypothetical protein